MSNVVYFVLRFTVLVGLSLRVLKLWLKLL